MRESHHPRYHVRTRSAGVRQRHSQRDRSSAARVTDGDRVALRRDADVVRVIGDSEILRSPAFECKRDATYIIRRQSEDESLVASRTRLRGTTAAGEERRWVRSAVVDVLSLLATDRCAGLAHQRDAHALPGGGEIDASIPLCCRPNAECGFNAGNPETDELVCRHLWQLVTRRSRIAQCSDDLCARDAGRGEWLFPAAGDGRDEQRCDEPDGPQQHGCSPTLKSEHTHLSAVRLVVGCPPSERMRCHVSGKLIIGSPVSVSCVAIVVSHGIPRWR